MKKPHSRSDILKRLQQKVAQGVPIIGAGAGTGLSAKCEEQGGIDLIVIYNSGRFRMAGRGSLAGLMPYGNANQIVKEMAGEVLTAVSHTPVLAGVCGTDPFLLRDCFLKELMELGFAGIQNFPTVGLVDGTFRMNLEETGMSYQMEVDCIAAAHELGLLTSPYVFNTNEAERMTKAGADLVVAHMGLTTSGMIGARTTKSLQLQTHTWSETRFPGRCESLGACKGARLDITTTTQQARVHPNGCFRALLSALPSGPILRGSRTDRGA